MMNMVLSRFFTDKLLAIGMDVTHLEQYDIYELCLTLRYYYPSISWRDFNLLSQYLDPSIEILLFQTRLREQRSFIPLLNEQITRVFGHIDTYISSMSPANIPMVAVVMRGDELISVATNGVGLTSHAEINAIVAAQDQLQQKYLSNCEIFCNFEPCVMCSGAIINSRIKAVHYADNEYQTGVISNQCNILNNPNLNKHTLFAGAYSPTKYTPYLQSFFARQRQSKAGNGFILNERYVW